MEPARSISTQPDPLGALHDSISTQLLELEARTHALVAGPPVKPDPNEDTHSSVGATKEPPEEDGTLETPPTAAD